MVVFRFGSKNVWRYIFRIEFFLSIAVISRVQCQENEQLNCEELIPSPSIAQSTKKCEQIKKDALEATGWFMYFDQLNATFTKRKNAFCCKSQGRMQVFSKGLPELCERTWIEAVITGVANHTPDFAQVAHKIKRGERSLYNLKTKDRCQDFCRLLDFNRGECVIDFDPKNRQFRCYCI